MEQQSKRDRSSNWSEEEKLLFVTLLQPHKKLLENKQKLYSTNKQKEDCWKEIFENFKLEGYNRPITRLKEQWRRMKMQAKKNLSVDNKNRKKTGSGSPLTSETTEIDQMVSSIAPHIMIEDVSEFDSDNRLNNRKKMSAYEEEMIKLNKLKIELAMKHMEEAHQLSIVQNKELHKTKLDYEKQLFEFKKSKIENE
ncbi:hypothetical protein RN001_009569 [Aquatica leii]|uniref:Regulatory protein zeste n=1 Tax=Aquatica leii TaxID=1421715 RepID=A0AAN7SMY9_9COLE|nr:hypothetical protein RN001_009569 [Aquatica leii]